ncbi:hypothetical protein AX16_010329 [Volvariella volvacea WC 439]|nr:hypothetical protein AX16_010329 [Volvariella volvacea WC 439]
MSEACSGLITSEIALSGRGIRISIYIQVFCVIVSTIHCRSYSKLRGGALALAITVVAYAAAAIILGLKPEPRITFYDAIMTTYLSLLPLEALTLMVLLCDWEKPTHQLFSFGIILIQVVFVAAILATVYWAPRFGNHPECFTELYLPFEGVQPTEVYRRRARALGWLAFGFIALEIVVFLAIFLHLNRRRQKLPAPGRESRSQTVTSMPNPSLKDDFKPIGLYWPRISALVGMISIYVLLVVTVELVRRHNRDLLGLPDEEWPIGQIMPVALSIPPIVETGILLYKVYGMDKQMDRWFPGSSSTADGVTLSKAS